MGDHIQINFSGLYKGFQAPISAMDCGDKCAPYNERGIPFCCDTRHMLPTAYWEEWRFLQANSELWRLWQPEDASLVFSLQDQVPDNQVLIACKGYDYCQRDFRSLTCRTFPFFPYINREGCFVGLSVYWEYEDRCWIINNLQVVTSRFRAEFLAAYDFLFERDHQELENFREFSSNMRRVYGRWHRAIPLLHRNGNTYKVTPRNGRMRRVTAEQLPKFGVYKIAAEMPFADEMDSVSPGEQ